MEREGLIEPSPTPTPTPTPSQYDYIQRETLRTALRTLPRAERLILILYYYEELSWDEISKQLGTTKEALIQRHKEILQKVKSMIKPFILSKDSLNKK